MALLRLALRLLLLPTLGAMLACWVGGDFDAAPASIAAAATVDELRGMAKGRGLRREELQGLHSKTDLEAVVTQLLAKAQQERRVDLGIERLALALGYGIGALLLLLPAIALYYAIRWRRLQWRVRTPIKKPAAPDRALRKKLEALSVAFRAFEGTAGTAATTVAPALSAGAECSICLAAFERGERCRQLRCQHSFHAACVDGWLTKSQQCPLCRQVVGRLRRRGAANAPPRGNADAAAAAAAAAGGGSGFVFWSSLLAYPVAYGLVHSLLLQSRSIAGPA
jgi:hypothetical protein